MSDESTAALHGQRELALDGLLRTTALLDAVAAGEVMPRSSLRATFRPCSRLPMSPAATGSRVKP